MPGEIDNLQIQISADSESASKNVLALADSLEKIATAAANATVPLAGFTKALSGLKAFDASGFSKSATDLSQAFNQFNNIGSIDNAVQLVDSVENLREAMSGLSDVSKSTKELKIGKGFTNSVDTLSSTLPKLSGVGNVDDAIAVLDSVENLEQATSGLRNIAENISSLKVGKSFDTNLENLSLAMAHLNEIGDTSAFGGGVEAISQAIERLNNIEIGQGFTSLIQASTQWADAVGRMNSNSVGSEFSQGIARIAKACEILNEVDFSGFKRMNDVLGALPDNVRVSFGASSDEVKQLTKSLLDLQGTVGSIHNEMPKRRPKTDNGTEETAEKPDYSWKTDEIKSVLDASKAHDEEAKQLKKVIAEFDRMGQDVPEDIQRAAESLGVFNRELDETGEKSSFFGSGVRNAFSGMKDKFSEPLAKIKEIDDAFAKPIGKGIFKALGAEVKAVMSPLTAIGSKFNTIRRLSVQTSRRQWIKRQLRHCI